MSSTRSSLSTAPPLTERLTLSGAWATASSSRRVAVTATGPGFEYIVEFLIKAERAGFKFAEIPSAEKARIAGKSKVNALYDGLRMLRLMARAWRSGRL